MSGRGSSLKQHIYCLGNSPLFLNASKWRGSVVGDLANSVFQWFYCWILFSKPSRVSWIGRIQCVLNSVKECREGIGNFTLVGGHCLSGSRIPTRSDFDHLNLKTRFCKYWTELRLKSKLAWPACTNGEKLKQKWYRSIDYS